MRYAPTRIAVRRRPALLADDGARADGVAGADAPPGRRRAGLRRARDAAADFDAPAGHVTSRRPAHALRHRERPRAALARASALQTRRTSDDRTRSRPARDRRAVPSDGLPLSAFTPTVRDWFARRVRGADAGAGAGLAGDRHRRARRSSRAPTGSGKTLAAFLWGLDRLAARSAAGPEKRTRLVYVSPLKALAYDVERNLRAPLRGIGADLTVAIRTGDTPQRERAADAAQRRRTSSSRRPSRST